jgi:hypothetical protein
MARIRYIKPDFFLDENLADLPVEARLLFAGLWCHSDKLGRMEDRPRRIKAQIFPYDSLDADALLAQLAVAGFIVRYTVDAAQYIEIINFTKHQKVHHTEKESMLPAPKDGELTVKHLISPQGMGKGMGNGERNGERNGAKPKRFDATRFEMFWKLYPNKKDKQKALEAFKRLNPDDTLLPIIMCSLQCQITWREKMAAKGQWVEDWKYGQGWINGKRWEDELAIVERSKANGEDKPFNELVSKVGVVSRMDVPEFDDQKIMPALNMCGGWMQLCAMSTKDIKWDFKPKFMEAYNGQ